MDPVFEGKTAAQWIYLLQTGWVPERCGAALALAELEPRKEPAKSALLAALHDVEKSVEVAAQIAIGFIHVPVENRRKMCEHLLGPDDYMQRTILQSLVDLGYSYLQGTASELEEEPIPPVELAPSSQPEPTVPAPVQAPVSPPPAIAVAPDIEVVHVMPWWILLGGIGLCLLVAWLLRGISWSRWVMLGATVPPGLFLLYQWTRKQKNTITPQRFRAHARLTCSAIGATLCGFGIDVAFPLGMVYIDNASVMNVRILLDGEPWMTVQAGESKKGNMNVGKHRLTFQAVDGDRILDEHDIETQAYRKYVLNVLGAQFYLRGWAHFGTQGALPKVVSDRWMEVSEIDYLFREPPDRILAPHSATKSYFLRLGPPKN